jgi:hypothetical protein
MNPRLSEYEEVLSKRTKHSASDLTLKMEAIISSETSAVTISNSTRHHSPESNRHFCCREKLRSQMLLNEFNSGSYANVETLLTPS